MSDPSEPQMYITLVGDSIRYPQPAEALAEFLQRVAIAAIDEQTSYLELVDVVYGRGNPLLSRDDATGRAVVPLAVFQNPVFHVMLDLLERKRMASMPAADLSAQRFPPGGLELRMGSEEGRSFSVKAPLLEGKHRSEGGAIEAVCPRFEQVAVKFTGTRSDGTKFRRMLVLEPGDDIAEHRLGQFFVRGHFVIVEKINNAIEAARRFREFEAR